MINVIYKNNEGRCIPLATLPTDIGDKPVWIDLQNPTPQEEKQTEATLGIQLLTREEVWKSDVLHRFYHEDGVYFMTAPIISKPEGQYPLTSVVTFILGANYLVTLRYINPTSFQNFAQRIVRKPQEFNGAGDILEGLLEEIITRIAYNSELVVAEMDKLSHDIFKQDAFEASRKTNASQMMKDMLVRLGASADLNSKIHESLHGLSRLLAFFKKAQGPSSPLAQALDTLTADVQALTQQTAFLSDKITFQLDAILGMINVEQNMIVKIFSIAAVFFLPPTLISSIYGMNFRNMPELEWMYGYPAAIGLMVMVAFIPFLYFRKKGWL